MFFPFLCYPAVEVAQKTILPVEEENKSLYCIDTDVSGYWLSANKMAGWRFHIVILQRQWALGCFVSSQVWDPKSISCLTDGKDQPIGQCCKPWGRSRESSIHLQRPASPNYFGLIGVMPCLPSQVCKCPTCMNNACSCLPGQLVNYKNLMWQFSMQ